MSKQGDHGNEEVTLASFREEWLQQLNSSKSNEGGGKSNAVSGTTYGLRSLNKVELKPLQPKRLDDSDGDVESGHSKTCMFKSPFSINKRQRTDTPKVVNEEKEPPKKKDGPDYLALFLNDLDDINDVPLFDTTLPREVVTNILSFLDYVSLCRCAQASSMWKTLAEDEVLWQRLMAQSQHRIPLNEKHKSLSMKQHFARVVLHRREVRRRWKEMAAVFHEILPNASIRRGHRRRNRNYNIFDDSNHNLTVASASSNCEFLVAGFANNTVQTFELTNPNGSFGTYEVPNYDADNNGNQEHNFDWNERNIYADGSAHAAAVAISPSIVSSLSSLGQLNVWHRSSEAHVFQHQLGNYVWQPFPMPLVAIQEIPSVVLACGSRISLYSANLTPEWEVVWEVQSVDASPVTAISSIGSSSVVTVSSGTASIFDIRRGQLIANLQDQSDGMASQCGQVTVDHGRILLSTSNITFGSAVKVFDCGSGMQVSALDIGRPADSIAFFKNDPHSMIVSSSAGLWCYDLRTERRTSQMYREGITVQSVEGDDWRVAGGGHSPTSGILNQGGVTAVWDRRMSKRLWYFSDKSVNRIQQVQMTDTHLFSTSAVPCVSRDELINSRSGCLNVLDFAAPNAELADAECPFSSTYDDVTGYRANDLLATPYDDVSPFKFG